MSNESVPVEVGTCPCGGYGILYGPELAAKFGRCHDTAETLSGRRVATSSDEAMQDDMAELLRILKLGDHARPQTPHAVMRDEIIPAVRRLADSAR